MTIERLNGRPPELRFSDATPPPTTSRTQPCGGTTSTQETTSTCSAAAPTGPETSGPSASSGSGVFAQVFGWFFGTIEAVLHGAVDVVCGAIKALLDGLAGLSKLPEQAVGIVMLVGGKAISAVQTLLGLESPGRRLTEEEAELLRNVYGQSIDLGAIRIKEGFAGVLSASARPFTLGNVIYLKDISALKRHELQALLVHEAMHVWQFQHTGPSYMPRSVVVQLTEGLAATYDCYSAIDAGKSWAELSPEEQGQFLEEAVKHGLFAAGGESGARLFLRQSTNRDEPPKDYTPYLRAALEQIRGGIASDSWY